MRSGFLSTESERKRLYEKTFTAQRRAAGELVMRSKADGDSCSRRSKPRRTASASGTKPEAIECAGQCVREGRPQAGRERAFHAIRPIAPRLQLYRPSRPGRIRPRSNRIRSCPSAATCGRTTSPAGRNLLFNGGPVDIELRTRSARLSNFEQRTAGANAVADAQIAHVDAAGGEVLAKGAEENGVARAAVALPPLRRRSAGWPSADRREFRGARGGRLLCREAQ